jgi:hypothetical protein
MADYYTNFSVVLPLTKEQKDYAKQIAHQVAQHRFQDQPLPDDFPASLKDEVENWTFETAVTEQGLWLHSQYGGQDAACVFIQHLLQRFKFVEGMTLEWSHDCSKPRTDAFGGGAAFVTTDQIKTFTTQQWLLEIVGARKHNIDPDSLCCIKCGKHMDAVENTICLP